jgi:alkanesulfonate monooxygenase SsuD/methylene tetrahydromethanopterin reductase-like flavin-dependent oxidoreductase (luciferase family)
LIGASPRAELQDMQIGIWIDDEQPLDAIVENVEEAAGLGFARASFGQRTGWDPLTLVTAVGSRVPGIGLATAVAPTWPQHPLALAAQALGTNAAVGGRLALGIGPSHQVLVESRYGYRWERPGRHVEDYLTVLVPALAGEAVDVRTETVAAAGAVTIAGATAPPVLLAAHGPRMLRLAGERAGGCSRRGPVSAGSPSTWFPRCAPPRPAAPTRRWSWG